MGRPWGRLYAGTRNHRKIRILRQQFPNHWWAWYVLIELAIETWDNGWVYAAPGRPYSLKELKNELGIARETTLKRFLNALEELQLIERNDGFFRLIGFSERNFESDYSTLRTRKYREKRKATGENETFPERSGNVPGERSGNPPDTETDTESTPLTPRKRGDDVAPDFDDRAPATEGANPRVSGTNPRTLGTNPHDNGYDPEFEAWWAEYPARRKAGKPKVYAKWKALKAQGQLLPLDQMLSVLRAQKQSPDWTKNGGDYIPGPHPYLNQFRFLDESVIQTQRYSPASPRADPDCPVCHGDGWELFEQDGREFSRRCRCWQVRDG